MATRTGPVPTVTAPTAPVAIVITDTVPSLRLVTYARLPSGVIRMSDGLPPTAMGAETAPVAVVITDTVPSPELTT